ncbi:MAG: ATP synthase F1 subunit delta [Flavobacteriaceae bacterium]|jgi:F-type H+-transporting ATPase subunit delta|nr:ATP synthase F1 subunit delta [Flavobacteriaceae bacterium]
MTNSRAAIRYAKALLQQAQETNVLEAVAADMQEMATIIGGNEDFKSFLANPTLTATQKQAGFEAVFKAVQPLVAHTFKALLDNKRSGLTLAVAVAFTDLYEQAQGKANAVVTSAVALSESLEKEIKEKVAKLINKEVTITNLVDPSLLGGFILRVGDLQYNASVAAQLQQLEREFTNI